MMTFGGLRNAECFQSEKDYQFRSKRKVLEHTGRVLRDVSDLYEDLVLVELGNGVILDLCSFFLQILIRTCPLGVSNSDLQSRAERALSW
jgi:hypothetical protein